MTGGKIVEHAHPVRLERIDQVRADETGAACDQDGFSR
jgi:hypothetical protein